MQLYINVEKNSNLCAIDLYFSKVDEDESDNDVYIYFT